MKPEGERRHLTPALWNYLRSPDTRARYLGKFHHINVIEQNSREGWYSFNATLKEHPSVTISVEALLLPDGTPSLTKTVERNAYSYPPTENTHLTLFNGDMEIVIQNLELTDDQKIYDLLSFRIRMKREGIGGHYLRNSFFRDHTVEISPLTGELVSAGYHGKDSSRPGIRIESNYFGGNKATSIIDGNVCEMKVEEDAITVSLFTNDPEDPEKRESYIFTVQRGISPKAYKQVLCARDRSWVNLFREIPVSLQVDLPDDPGKFDFKP